MTGPWMRRVRGTLAALALAVLAACETGPRGPRTLQGRVTGPADLAGAVLDVVWSSITGFEGQGSTQVYSAPVAGEDNRYRVILVAPSGGPLTFGVRVDGVYLHGPVITVVEAVASDNLPRPVGDLRVVLER
jgi:hypothetical protein